MFSENWDSRFFCTKIHKQRICVFPVVHKTNVENGFFVLFFNVMNLKIHLDVFPRSRFFLSPGIIILLLGTFLLLCCLIAALFSHRHYTHFQASRQASNELVNRCFDQQKRLELAKVYIFEPIAQPSPFSNQPLRSSRVNLASKPVKQTKLSQTNRGTVTPTTNINNNNPVERPSTSSTNRDGRSSNKFALWALSRFKGAQSRGGTEEERLKRLQRANAKKMTI